MRLDHLLIWLSERRAGSWNQFRSAVEQFDVDPEIEPAPVGEGAGSSDFPIYQTLRHHLDVLGHVEFRGEAPGARWRIAPATLAVRRDRDSWVGTLCGARPGSLCRSLAEPGPAVTVTCGEAPGMPSRIELRSGDASALVTAATDLGLRVQFDAPHAILASLAPVTSTAYVHSGDLPATIGWSVARFSLQDAAWKPVDPITVARSRTGLFRFRMGWRIHYYLRVRGVTHTTEVQRGKYALLRLRRSRIEVRHIRGRCSVTAPLTYRPPQLFERALVLCSGTLPILRSDERRIEYPNVPLEVARLTWALLGQEVRVD